jgi:predicted metal-dependent phosphoesterase TrpH
MARPTRRPRRLRSGADLHVHTTHSDGACTPAAVVIAAAAVGLEAVAITDHDTLSALTIARVEADRVGITLIDGVEISAHDGRRGVHLLAYFFDPAHAELRAALDGLRAARVERMRAIVARLEALGIAVDLDRLRERSPRAALGRRHLADWLVATGQVTTRGEAFARLLGDGAPAHVPAPHLEADRAIALVRAAGGVVGLAHPPYDSTYESFRAWRDRGVEAVEVAGPGVHRPQGERFRAWADRLGLVAIAGTDFHAPDGPGRWVGAIATPDEAWRELRDRKARPSSPSDSPRAPRDGPA